jgi:hypothetical protein
LIADVGLYTFQEAFDKTGRIINITVAPNNNYDPPRLLNYLTAPHVCVWSAAAASCALPGKHCVVLCCAVGHYGIHRITTWSGAWSLLFVYWHRPVVTAFTSAVASVMVVVAVVFFRAC